MAGEATVENCVDIVWPVRDELEDAGLLTKVQFFGGIGSAALTNRFTVISPDGGEIIAPINLHLPSMRDDGNKRDIDVLVRSTDQNEIDEVEGIVEEVVGDRLEVSVFGYLSGEYTEDQVKHPYGWKALKMFVSDRTVRSDGDVDKVLFPFAVPVEPETLESSQLIVGDLTLPVTLAPTTLLNYATRSISGLRAKDARKVQVMAANIFEQAPDFADWIRTGPGASQLELARIAHSLQGPNSVVQADTIVLGGAVEIAPMPIRSLMDHDAFVLDGSSRRTQENALALARIKSMALRKAESYEEIVRLYQKYAEPLLDGISKNK